MLAMQRILIAVSGLVLISGTGCVLPDPPVTTIWQKLGVPQGVIGLRDSLVNRRGNFPGLERKPPLLPIAAPQNLESPYEMIKVAAKVKQAEDLKKQKIKALKYLGTIGCGCYDKDGAIEAALLEALADCTPEVRIAAAEAIQSAVGECCCVDGCAQTCCTKKVQEKLAELAYGEKDGCYTEPNPEVRAAALAALTACPPLVDDAIIETEEVIPEVPDTETLPEASGTSTTSIHQGTGARTVSAAQTEGVYYEESVRVIPSPNNSPLVPSLHIQPEFEAPAADAEENVPEADEAGLIPAMIEMFDTAKGRVQIAFFDSYQIPVGTPMVIVSGGTELDVVVTSTSVGRVESGLTGEVPAMSRLASGDMIKIGILAN